MGSSISSRTWRSGLVAALLAPASARLRASVAITVVSVWFSVSSCPRDQSSSARMVDSATRWVSACRSSAASNGDAFAAESSISSSSAVPRIWKGCPCGCGVGWELWECLEKMRGYPCLCGVSSLVDLLERATMRVSLLVRGYSTLVYAGRQCFGGIPAYAGGYLGVSGVGCPDIRGIPARAGWLLAVVGIALQLGGIPAGAGLACSRRKRPCIKGSIPAGAGLAGKANLGIVGWTGGIPACAWVSSSPS